MWNKNIKRINLTSASCNKEKKYLTNRIETAQTGKWTNPSWDKQSREIKKNIGIEFKR